MNVFITQENHKLDFSPAESFGDIVFLTNREYSPISSSMNNADILREINEKMAFFKPDEDFLLMSGDPVTMGYAFHQAIKIKGYIKLLKWNRLHNKYNEIHLKE